MYIKAMDTNILKYQAFVKSAETKSFTKAAESLHYTQSGISRMIADLENEWQVSLFSRGKKGLELTEDGKRLLPYAEGLCASFERLEGEAFDLRGLSKGTIRIGVFSSVATYWLPSIIAAFQKEHPGISYQLKLGDYEEIEGWINDGEVDCGFLTIPCKTPLDFFSLARDEALVVLPEGHPLCAKEKISLQDLSSYSFLMGSIYTLVFGFGMVLCLKAMTFEGLDWLGYVLGGVGLLGLVGNYYVYKVFLAHQKAIYGNRIVEVSKKILG